MEWIWVAISVFGLIVVALLWAIVALTGRILRMSQISDARLDKTLDAALAISTFELERMRTENDRVAAGVAGVPRRYTVPTSGDREPPAEPIFAGVGNESRIG